MGCPPGLPAENYNRYVLLIYYPDVSTFTFWGESGDGLTYTDAEATALSWRSVNDVLHGFCVGIVSRRKYLIARPDDILEALRWYEERQYRVQNIASAREQKLQDENQAFRDQVQLLEQRITNLEDEKKDIEQFYRDDARESG